MSRVFADTSGVYALLVATDATHAEAAAAFRRLRARRAALVTTSYVLVESVALLARQVGLNALAAFGRLEALIDVVWVDAEFHDNGWTCCSNATSETSAWSTSSRSW